MEFSDDSHEMHVPMGKALAYEEALNRQLDRIAYLRSAGRDWSEALYQLRDMLVGQEDEQFFDGIPEHKRKELEGLDDEKAKRKIREQFQEQGWDTHTVPWVMTGRGPVFLPSPQDLSRELRMLMGLMVRKNMLQRYRTSSRLPEDAVKGHTNPGS